MATITMTIPTEKVEKALEGFLELYPNNEMTEATEETEAVAKYTDLQWVKEKMKRILIRDIHRGLNLKAERQATIIEDAEMVS